jgi:hypothetical protein
MGPIHSLAILEVPYNVYRNYFKPSQKRRFIDVLGNLEIISSKFPVFFSPQGTSHGRSHVSVFDITDVADATSIRARNKEPKAGT